MNYFCEQAIKLKLKIFLETSGAYKLTGKWNWICLSPKKQKPPLPDIYNIADELKVIIENDSDFIWAEKCRKKVAKKCKLYLQPEWSKHNTMTHKIVEYIKNNPVWNISVQLHKYIKIP